MNCCSVDTEVEQCAFNTVALALGIAEHHCLTRAGGHGSNHAVFVEFVYSEEEMAHGAHGVGGTVDRYFNRVLQVTADEVTHLAVECC